MCNRYMTHGHPRKSCPRSSSTASREQTAKSWPTPQHMANVSIPPIKFIEKAKDN